jgi:hypothetical protein
MINIESLRKATKFEERYSIFSDLMQEQPFFQLSFDFVVLP